MLQKLLDKPPIFSAENHSYIDDDGFKYKSVTEWVNRYKPYFDKEKAAERVAKKNGLLVEDILKEWDDKRVNSTLFGSRIHKAIEKFNLEDRIEDRECTAVIKNLQEAKITFNKKQSYFEQIVSSKKIGIAGTADVIEVFKDKTFNVYDFKTNKKFRIQSYLGNETLLTPFNHFPNSEYFLYALQLSMYAYIIKTTTGLTPKQLRVFWYDRVEPENYKNFNGKWQIYDLPYLEHDIIRSFEYEKKT